MIDYATWCAIQKGNDEHLTAAQLAAELQCNIKTVRRWIGHPYQPRQAPKRPSRLDPFKGRIVRWLEAHPFTAQQVFQRLREEGFAGGISIVKDYVRIVRPRPREAFLTLAFAPGECAQVDWGEWGTIAVGGTRRRLSFFVMVLAYCRRMYVEFMWSQTMEHFLTAHMNAFNVLGVPRKVMVDNLRSAVLSHPRGQPPVFNPRYLDFARHYGFEIVACAVAKGNEKGRAERGVGYVKGNFLRGLEMPGFAALNPAARYWLESVADVRVHGETHRRPVDLWAEEHAYLQPVNPRPFDPGRVLTVRANRQFRVSFDGNRYSVPARFAGSQVVLKAYPDRLCVYQGEVLIARHARSFDRHQDIEDPDHPKALLEQRRHARDQHALQRFLALSPQAAAYYAGLCERRGNAMVHVRKIVALVEIHGSEPVIRAMADALAFEAFSSEYIAHLIEARGRKLPEASPLSLTHRQDVLDLELPPPDLSAYPDTPLSMPEENSGETHEHD